MPSIHTYKTRMLTCLSFGLALVALGIYLLTAASNAGIDALDGACLISGIVLLFNATRNGLLLRAALRDGGE